MRHDLVIDRSRPVRIVARRIFETPSFATEAAENGTGALASCDRAVPDVILLDWRPLDMNGIDFARSLRNRRDGDTLTVSSV